MIEIYGEQKPIRLGLTGVDEIVQNVRIILSTAQGSVPLDRNFGMEITSMDEPITIAKARLTTAIMYAIAEYEPRAIVQEVQFEEDLQTGKLIPIVKIEVEGGG